MASASSSPTSSLTSASPGGRRLLQERVQPRLCSARPLHPGCWPQHPRTCAPAPVATSVSRAAVCWQCIQPSTNNRAELDLRVSKIKQRVSGCVRNQQCAEAYCRISSYLQTMAYRGYNPLLAIQMALSDEFYADRREQSP